MRWFNRPHEKPTDPMPNVLPDYSAFIPSDLPFQVPILYTSDSYIPSGDILPNSLPRLWLEGGDLGSYYNGMMLHNRRDTPKRAQLPYTVQELNGRLPPYVKLYTAEVNGHTVHIVNPSSKILDCYDRGRFLFRGESSKTSDKDAELIIHHLSRGYLEPRRSVDGVDGANYVYTTPWLYYGLSFGARSRNNFSGHIWVIDRNAMNKHLISIDYGDEILFPEIYIEHLTACITTPDIKARVEQGIGSDLPVRLVEINPDDSWQHVEQIVGKL